MANELKFKASSLCQETSTYIWMERSFTEFHRASSDVCNRFFKNNKYFGIN